MRSSKDSGDGPVDVVPIERDDVLPASASWDVFQQDEAESATMELLGIDINTGEAEADGVGSSKHQVCTSDIAAMVKRAKADSENFSELYNHFRKKIVGYCANLVGLSDAEDVAEQTFLKILHKMQIVDETKSFSGFLYSTAFGTCVDHLRQRKRMHARHVAAVEEWLATATTKNETEEAAYRAHLVADCMQELPELECTIILLHGYQGIGFQRIADELQMSIGYVYKHWMAAIDLLRQYTKTQEDREESHE